MFCGAYGRSDTQGRYVQHDAMVRWYGNGKIFGSLLALLMKERGWIGSLEDPVAKHLPAFNFTKSWKVIHVVDEKIEAAIQLKHSLKSVGNKKFVTISKNQDLLTIEEVEVESEKKAAVELAAASAADENTRKSQ